MNSIQKWFLIGAVWVIAISLFMIGLQRYTPWSTPSFPGVVDKWTGILSFEQKKAEKTPDLFDKVEYPQK